MNPETKTLSAKELEDRYVLPTYSKMPFVLARAQGNCVFDETGRRYLDLYGGHAVSVLGHSHPRWVEALKRQLDRLDFYSAVAYLENRGRAAQWLVEKSYSSMRQVFFCNSGTEANETALKVARKATGRAEIVALEAGFHGRTLGSLSVTGTTKLREAFPQNLAGFTRWVKFGDLAAIASLDASKLAAVILEPVQSMAGVQLAPAEYFRKLREHCSRHGIVLIFDEVQTGAGRTGRWFFGGHVGVEPDLVTCAKGIGGGFPVGAVIANQAMAATVKPGDQGSTFGGGPLACAAVCASFEILESEGLVALAEKRGAECVRRLQALAGRGLVTAARGLGYLIGVDTTIPAKDVQARFLKRDILIGTSDVPGTFRLLPPLTVGEAEWEQFFKALEEISAEIRNGA